MELNTQFFEIADVLSLISKGKLVLPEFQRDFEWTPAAIADLLRTIVRRWPAGTLLFLKSEGDLVLAPKRIERGPDPHAPEFFILDGQQRLTSVYHSFEEQGDEIYYLRMKDVLEAGEFEDEHLLFEKKAKFVKKYPSVEAKARDHVLEIGAVRDEIRFGDWCDRLKQEERADYRKLRSTILGGIANYRLPALVLGREMPLQAIAKIFETINKTGVRLGFLDLMVAKLFPLEFRLRNKIEDARSGDSKLKRFGFDGHEPLQLLALREHFRQAHDKAQRVQNGEKNVPPIKVKGVREGDMLALDPTLVVASWEQAVLDYSKAVTFVSEHCGVIGEQVLPSDAMLIPLAYALSLDATREGFASDLQRWFWATCFLQTYSQGANTQVVRDARELRAWASSAAAVPEVIKRIPTKEALRESVLEPRKRNEMALRGLMCLLLKRDARDWSTGELLRDVDPEKLDFHHVFPENYLKKQNIAVPDKLLNFTPLQRDTNIKLRDIPPSEILKRNDIQKHAIESHRVPLPVFASNDHAKFDAARADALVDLVLPLLRGS